MKNTFWLILAFGVVCLSSCKKEDAAKKQNGYIKTVDSVAMDPQFGLIPLDDGNYVVVSDGQLVKLDDRGTVYWRKPVSEIAGITAAVAEPGAGFVLFGVPSNPPTQSSYYACRYDMDGNLLTTKQVNVNFPIVYVEPPVSMIRLANGGFAVAMASSFVWSGYLKILDRDFNIVHSKILSPPAGFYGLLVRNICELPNGDLVLSSTLGGYEDDKVWINAALALTGPDGTVKAFTILGDSTVNQIAHAVSPCAGGFFSASSTKSGFLSTDGAFVNYYHGTQIAGTMLIDKFNAEGQYTGSRRLTGAAGYGVIKSIRRTLDNGFLLCGTVGNNGSSVSVSNTKMYVCKLDAGLNQTWSKTIETTYQAIGSDAVQTSDGGCLAAGNLKSFGNTYQMVLIRTDANGSY